MPMLSGGQLVARQLQREGTPVLFTLCGGHIMNIYDGCLDVGIRVVDVRHEQAAAFAADAWARLTGRPGVAAVTAGPGVTNAVTAVATAMRAQSPLVLLGGQGPLSLAGRGSLQEMDTLSLLRPITKWAVQVHDTARIPEYIHMAFRRALSGVPGPVYLELPLDVLFNQVDESAAPLCARSPDPAPAPPPGDAVAGAAALLRAARRPAALVGSQIRWSPHWQALAEFSGHAQVPVYASGMARGIPGATPLARSRKTALAEADLILVAGTPLDFRLNYGQNFPAGAQLIQIDLDPAELGRNRSPDVGMAADPGTAFRHLVAAGCTPADPDARTGWWAHLEALASRAGQKMQAGLHSDASPADPLRLCHEVGRWLPENATVIGDGGDFVATAANVLQPRRYPAGWLDPGPLGTLGCGFGYAMAAALARPGEPVVLLLGDGAAGLDLLELEAAVRQHLPFVAVVGNDGAWTQIRRTQVQMFGSERAPATGLSRARYDLVAAILGAHAEYVTAPDGLRPALERALASGRPALVNVEMGASDFRAGAISV